MKKDNLTTYLTTNKLIDNLSTYFKKENIDKAEFVYIYFDKMYEG